MTEAVYLNGAPVVGLGDANISVSNPIIYTPFIGYVVGATGGGVLGSLVSKKSRISTGVGTALGGFGGMIAGVWLGRAIASTSPKAKEGDRQRRAAGLLERFRGKGEPLDVQEAAWLVDFFTSIDRKDLAREVASAYAP